MNSESIGVMCAFFAMIAVLLASGTLTVYSGFVSVKNHRPKNTVTALLVIGGVLVALSPLTLVPHIMTFLIEPAGILFPLILAGFIITSAALSRVSFDTGSSALRKLVSIYSGCVGIITLAAAAYATVLLILCFFTPVVMN